MVMDLPDNSLLGHLRLPILLALAPTVPLRLLLQLRALLGTNVLVRMVPVVGKRPFRGHIKRAPRVHRRTVIERRVGVVSLPRLQGIRVSLVLLRHLFITFPGVCVSHVF